MLGVLPMLWLVTLSSRVVINEVMANPRGSNSQHPHCPEDRNEFVEMNNRSDDTIDLLGWRLTDFDALDTLRAWGDSAILAQYPNVRICDTRILPHAYALVLDPDYTDPEPESGFVQPYRFPDGLLLLRPGNTTIGDGLSNKDPLAFWSHDSSEVSSFGTFGSGAFPCDAGDGVSWERVSPDAPDCDTAWYRCQDPDGCTPGRANWITTYENLACTELLCLPLSYFQGAAETILVTVRNTGRVMAENWQVRMLVDGVGGVIPDLKGNSLAPGGSLAMTATWLPSGPGRYRLTALIDCPGDRDSSDNRKELTLELGTSRQSFSLQTGLFGPNLKTGPETLRVNFSLPDAGGTLTVKAYDLNGRERAVLFQGPIRDRFGAVSWNGRDHSGRLLPVGLYVIGCEYRSGKLAVFEKKTVVLAKGKP